MPQDRKVFYSESYRTGRAMRETCFCYSHKAKESHTVVVWDIGSEMSMETLLKDNGYEEIERGEYSQEVFGLAMAQAG